MTALQDNQRSIRVRIARAIALQVLVVILLYILGPFWPVTRAHIFANYALALGYFMITYSLVIVADRPDQQGGYFALNFLGFPRTRRLFFLGFAGYATMGPLAVSSWLFSVGSGGWRPIEMQSADACLLMACIQSWLCALMMRNRYRSSSARSDAALRKLRAEVMFVLITLAAFYFTREYSIYSFILSALAVFGVVTQMHYLSRAEFIPFADLTEKRSIGILSTHP